MKLKVGTKLTAKKDIKMKGIIVYCEGKDYVITGVEGDIYGDIYIVPSPTLRTGMFNRKELLKIFKVVGQKTFKERIFGK